MDNKELEEKPSDSTEQVTSTVKTSKPKDPGRIAAGKKHNKKVREAKKASEANRANKEIPNENKDERKKTYDLAVEKYQKKYEKYKENRAKFNDWIMTNDNKR